MHRAGASCMKWSVSCVQEFAKTEQVALLDSYVVPSILHKQERLLVGMDLVYNPRISLGKLLGREPYC